MSEFEKAKRGSLGIVDDEIAEVHVQRYQAVSGLLSQRLFRLAWLVLHRNDSLSRVTQWYLQESQLSPN